MYHSFLIHSFADGHLGALGRPRGMVWGGKREEGLGWGTRVYLCIWIHVDIWQNQYNIVKLNNKIKFKKKRKKIFLGERVHFWLTGPSGTMAFIAVH